MSRSAYEVGMENPAQSPDERELSGQFKTLGERLQGEREERIAARPRILSFGVRFLDMALGGIFAHDLILIGAKTGAGKTALATSIAIANARRGKRVHYFALEAEDREIERRQKFALVSEMVSKLNPRGMRRLNYLDWYSAKIDDVTGPHEAAAEKALSSAFATMKTFYRSHDFYAEQFERMVLAIQDETDLVVLDHLHYVDSEDPNENRGYKLVVKKIRDVALMIGKPVIVVAHVRKSDRRQAQLVPGIEDFHGTSDVPKIATKAIMIAPAFDQPSDDPCLWPTYLSPAKCRFDSTRTRYVGLALFDVRAGAYRPEFDLGRVTGDKWEPVDNSKMPEWAKDAAP